MADLQVHDPPPDEDAAPAADDAAPRRTRRRRRSSWAELPALVIVALVLALLLKTFVVQAFYIPSSSMEPTLEVGDRVLVTKTAYLYREPVRGEIVVFTEDLGAEAPPPTGNVIARGVQALASGLGVVEGSERDFIKRIIGLPGDVIELREGVVFINGEELPESPQAEGGYLSLRDVNDFGPVTVEPDRYFMLGDNRPNSADSRFGLGQIHRDQILGRAFVTLWPLTQAGSLPIADY